MIDHLHMSEAIRYAQ